MSISKTTHCFIVLLSFFIPNIAMNNDQKPSISSWITSIQKLPSKGTSNAKDKYGIPVLLEWEIMNILSPQFSEHMKNIWDIGKSAYTSVEMDFLRAYYADVIGKEPYFKPFEELFAHEPEAVDWQAVEQKMQEALKRFFVFDVNQWSKDMLNLFIGDVHIVATVKDAATQATLGFITFFIRPSYAYGTVKVTHLAVSPNQQNRGLGKLLMSSIFKIIPETSHIFLGTRVTNTVALNAYHAWGFVQDHNPVQDPQHTFNLKHWTFMEYKTEQSDILQKLTTQMK